MDYLIYGAFESFVPIQKELESEVWENFVFGILMRYPQLPKALTRENLLMLRKLLGKI